MDKLIGLTGKAQSGKTTAAGVLKANGYREESFAAPIRQFVADLCEWDLTELEENKDTVITEYGCTARHMMQTLGTEWGRGIHPKFWLISLRQRAKKGDKIVIADVRFENEADFIRRNGGKLIHIQRDDCPEVEAHSSESGIVFYEGDILIKNNTTICDLAEHIHQVIHNG